MLDNSILTSEKWVVTESLIEDSINEYRRNLMAGMVCVTILDDVYYSYWTWNMYWSCVVGSRELVAE